MNIKQKRRALVALWTIISLTVLGLYTHLVTHKVPVEYDPSTFTAEQQREHDSIVGAYQMKLVGTATTSDGATVYMFRDGSYSRVQPEWYLNGKIVPTSSDKKRVARLADADVPRWMFWRPKISAYDYQHLLGLLGSMLTIGLIVGLVIYQGKESSSNRRFVGVVAFGYYGVLGIFVFDVVTALVIMACGTFAATAGGELTNRLIRFTSQHWGNGTSIASS